MNVNFAEVYISKNPVFNFTYTNLLAEWLISRHNGATIVFNGWGGVAILSVAQIADIGATVVFCFEGDFLSRSVFKGFRITSYNVCYTKLLRTEIINGTKYILIRADENVEVNGVNIHISW